MKSSDRRWISVAIEVGELRKMGYRVFMTENNPKVRINGRLSLWPNRMRWFDQATGKKGYISEGGLKELVKHLGI